MHSTHVACQGQTRQMCIPEIAVGQQAARLQVLQASLGQRPVPSLRAPVQQMSILDESLGCGLTDLQTTWLAQQWP